MNCLGMSDEEFDEKFGFKEGDLSPETVRSLLNSPMRSTPTNTRATNIKAGVAGFVVTDIAINALQGKKPITFSVITGLFYIILGACGIVLVFNAFKWLSVTIWDLISSGAKALCGI